MTKKEHDALQKLMNEMNELRDRSEQAFKRLQDLNAKDGTGKRWCCAKTNATDLLGCGKDYMYLYEEYVQANAKEDMLVELGHTLAELNFWKQNGTRAHA